MSDKKTIEQIDEPKRWQHFTHPDGESAVNFANTAPAQLAGEASFAVGPDGQVHSFLFF